MQENNKTQKFPYSPLVRLHYRRDYVNFFSNSECIKLSECIIFRTQNGRSFARLGITVKAKVNSIHRNKVKRQIRECFRLVMSNLESYDFNVVVPGFKTVSPKYLRALRCCLLNEWIDATPVKTL